MPGRDQVTALSWSGGKDCARALAALHEQDVSPVALLTTVDESSGRVTHHQVPRELLRAQADAVGLPLVEVPVPKGGSGGEYAKRMRAAFADPRMSGVTAVAFGDLFLEDLRRYREERLASAGLAAVFPLWGRDTQELADEIAGGGYRATVVSVDPGALGAEYLGRDYDPAFLAELPAEVDPCGERGEFHTFVSYGPPFDRPVRFELGATAEVDGFPIAVLRPPSDQI